jgi:hypothetical protein
MHGGVAAITMYKRDLIIQFESIISTTYEIKKARILCILEHFHYIHFNFNHVLIIHIKLYVIIQLAIKAIFIIQSRSLTVE